MTRRERAIVLKAISELMADDGDFSSALAALGGLVGLRYPVEELKASLSEADLYSLYRSGENQEFSVKIGEKKGDLAEG
jgi:hypothetical protein